MGWRWIASPGTGSWSWWSRTRASNDPIGTSELRFLLDWVLRAPTPQRSSRGTMGHHRARTGRASERFPAPRAGARHRGLPVLPRQRVPDPARSALAPEQRDVVAARGPESLSSLAHRDPALPLR